MSIMITGTLMNPRHDDCENLNPCHWALAWGYAVEEGTSHGPSEKRLASFTIRDSWHFEEGQKQSKRERQLA